MLGAIVFGPLVLAPVAVVPLALGLAGCTSAYYGAMEQVGRDKRDILKSRIEAGREDQQEAQEQFKTTYQRFQELTGYAGGELESVYDRVAAEYERSEARAEDVRERIESIERVAEDLFAEWRQELGTMQSAGMKAESKRLLAETETRYARLIAAMKKAESKMPPVLTAFRDQVLFLKHNLNARAVASLSGTLGELEGDVDRLIRDIDASIRETDRFLATLEPAR